MDRYEQLAHLLLSDLDTPVMEGVLEPDHINWSALLYGYPYLSHGEQATVDLACSITGRPCFATDRKGNHPSLQATLGAVSEDLRETMVIVLHRLVNE